MKEINYLLGYKNLKIVQDKEMFKFSLDSILLPNFATINKRYKNILDIGTGNAPILLVLSTKTKANLVGVEIQEESYNLAYESVKMNNLDNQITLINSDIKDYARGDITEYYDSILCNPPYFPYLTSSEVNKNDLKTLARHEKSLTLEDIMKISRKLLKNNGNLAFVHRPDRLVDIITLMRANNIEPKRIQFVYPKEGKDANILLVEGTKNGAPGIKILEPLYVYDNNGEYTNKIKKYFE
jgi:tRNA1(Val) A37 N6-methylase TrmN6